MISSDVWAAAYSSCHQAPGDASHQVPRACFLRESLCYLVQGGCVSLTALCIFMGTCTYFSSSLTDYKVLQSSSICSCTHVCRKKRSGEETGVKQVGAGSLVGQKSLLEGDAQQRVRPMICGEELGSPEASNRL